MVIASGWFYFWTFYLALWAFILLGGLKVGLRMLRQKAIEATWFELAFLEYFWSVVHLWCLVGVSFFIFYMILVSSKNARLTNENNAVQSNTEQVANDAVNENKKGETVNNDQRTVQDRPRSRYAGYERRRD